MRLLSKNQNNMFIPKIFDIIIPDTSLKEIEDYFYNQEKLKNK
jgi:hypothetical protein